MIKGFPIGLAFILFALLYVIAFGILPVVAKDRNLCGGIILCDCSIAESDKECHDSRTGKARRHR